MVETGLLVTAISGLAGAVGVLWRRIGQLQAAERRCAIALASLQAEVAYMGKTHQQDSHATRQAVRALARSIPAPPPDDPPTPDPQGFQAPFSS